MTWKDILRIWLEALEDYNCAKPVLQIYKVPFFASEYSYQAVGFGSYGKM